MNTMTEAGASSISPSEFVRRLGHHLDDLRDDRPDSVSGGDIARALIRKAVVMLAEELDSSEAAARELHAVARQVGRGACLPV